MRHVNITALRNQMPENWNLLWRAIKAEKPAYAEDLQDPFFGQCVEMFDASISLPMRDIPQSAHHLIPDTYITH